MKRLVKSVKKQTAQLAKDVVKRGTAEIVEIPKKAPSQLIGTKRDQLSPIKEAMTHSDGKTPEVSAEEEREMKKEELRSLRRVREDAERESRKAQEKEVRRQASIQKEVVSQPGRPLRTFDRPVRPGGSILPASKPTRKMAPITPAAKKQRKVETRLGKN